LKKRPRRRPVRVRSRGVPASNNPDWAGRLLHFSLSPPNSYGPAKPSNHRFVQFSLRGLPSRSRQKTGRAAASSARTRSAARLPVDAPLASPARRNPPHPCSRGPFLSPASLLARGLHPRPPGSRKETGAARICRKRPAPPGSFPSPASLLASGPPSQVLRRWSLRRATSTHHQVLPPFSSLHAVRS